MLILGIETSCDETSASLVENGTVILSNIVASSQELHIKTGGIIPEVAAREQIKCMIPVIEDALKTGCGWVVNCEQNPITHNSPPPVDAVAVTVGPGLIGSLLIGSETAKTLAYLWHKPLIPVNHLLAHVYANWLISEHSENSEHQMVRSSDNLKIRNSEYPSLPSFPIIALIVSGGHTELLLIKNHGDYEVLGGTRDDAAGEAFDKIARLLGLGYPGGPAIAAAAKTAASRKQQVESKDKNVSPLTTPYLLLSTKLPRPMIDSHDYDFSFSGLKTAVLRIVQEKGWVMSSGSSHEDEGKDVSLIRTTHPRPTNHNSSPQLVSSLAYEVQEAITDVLVEKTVGAAKEYNVKTILLCGGVSANSRLREKFKVAIEQSNNGTIVFAPPPSLCTDNAAAIASCAFFNFRPIPWTRIKVNPSLSL